MKRYLLSCLALFMGLFAHAQATDLVVDCQTPGWLSSKIDYGDQQTVKNLKVTGYINTTDLNFIGSLIQNEQLDGMIDLSDCNIAGEKKDYLGANCFGINTYDSKQLRFLSLPKTLKGLESILNYKSGNVLIVDTLLFNCDIKYINHGMFDGRQFAKTPVNLIIESPIDSIPDAAFLEHIGIKTVFLPNSIRYVGNLAFLGSTLEKINIDAFDNIEYLGYKAFFPVKLDTLIFPKTLDVFHASTFSYNENAHIFLHENVKKIQAQESPRWNYKFSFSGHLNIHFKTQLPPENEVTFNDNYTIYIPKGSKESYQNIYNYKNAIIIEENPIVSIKMSDNEIIMDKGQDKQLSVDCFPSDADDKNISWNTSNNNIASVNEHGLVKAISPGQAYIFATSVATGIKDSCFVTVRKKVTSIEFEDPSIFLTSIGESKRLVVKVSPEDATEQSVVYKSLNESVCYVSDNGLVIAVNYGTGVVTATTVDGDHTAVCTVKVVHPCDVNCDGKVDVADIATIISFMAGTDSSLDRSVDVNNDGNVDVADIATIIDEMAAQTMRQK